MKSCILLLSGGQDSTTCLAWAKDRFKEVHAITFFSAQKHDRELLAAKKVAEVLKIDSHEFINIDRNILNPNKIELPSYIDVKDIPNKAKNNFSPGRDLLFLTIVANRAYSLGIYDVVLSIRRVICDNSFYFLDKVTEVLSLGVFGEITDFRIHTPLLDLTKKKVVLLSRSLGVLPLMQYTHSCHKNVFPPCKCCVACLLREEGFKEAGYADPLLKQTQDMLILEVNNQR